jgi:steroid delta-isomerase-like uncharacterized protein
VTLGANKDVIRRFQEAGSAPARDLDAIWDSFSPECRFHGLPGKDGQALTLAGYKKVLLAYFEALPDAVFTIEDMIAEDDKVWFRLSIQGTHRGVLRGVPATGRRVSYTQIGMFRVRDGKIVQTDALFDNLTLLTQLGETIIQRPVA